VGSRTVAQYGTVKGVIGGTAIAIMAASLTRAVVEEQIGLYQALPGVYITAREDEVDYGVGCDCSSKYTRPEMQSGLEILAQLR
jgi:hypothetical protein